MRSIWRVTTAGVGLTLGAACSDFSANDGPLSDPAVTDAGAEPGDAARPEPPVDGSLDAAAPPPSCGAHQRYVDDAQNPGCRCAPGFSDGDTGCTWTGVVQDPDLIGEPAGVWAIDGGTLDTSDGGRIAYERGTAALTQTLELPTLAELATGLKLSTQRSPLNVPFLAEELGFVDASRRARLDVNANESCVGERLLGSSITMRFDTRFTPPGIGSFPRRWSLEQITMVPSAECPMPGEIPNHDFEGIGGWRGVASSGVSYDFGAGHGVGGSMGARIQRADQCSAAVITNTVAVPMVGEAVALEVTARSPESTPFFVSLGSARSARTTTAVFDVARVCVPTGLRGLSPQLQLGVAQSFAANCSTLPATTSYFDEIRFVEDPSCAALGPIASPGFDDARSWTPVTSGTGVSQAVNDGGNRAYHLSTNVLCDSATVSTTVDIPQSGSWAVAARRKGNLAGNSVLNMTVAGRTRSATLSRSFGMIGPVYDEQRVCVPPELLGGLTTLTFTLLSTTGGDCSDPMGSSVLLDDVNLVEDPSCAAP